MKKIAMMLALLFTASVGFDAVAADSNTPANATEDEIPHMTYPVAPSSSAADAASGSISGTTIAYIVGGVVVVAAVASHKGSTGTH